jgi:hypothetical protein
MDTAIFIRVKIGDRWENRDIGDRETPVEQVLAWIETLDLESSQRLNRTLLLTVLRTRA